jgi:hypothetical protein
VFGFLGRGRQKGMERLIVENVFRRIFGYWKEKLPNKIQLVGKTLTLDFSVFSDRDKILDWLEDAKHTGFDDKKPSGYVQPELNPLD